jgi:RNA-binding protein YhbY
MRRPEDKKVSAQELAKATSSVVCGLVGHTVILYRPHPKERKIKLPA